MSTKITLRPEAVDEVMRILAPHRICDHCGKTEDQTGEEVLIASCGDGLIAIHRSCVRDYIDARAALMDNIVPLKVLSK